MEHPGLADEPRRDQRHAYALWVEVLPQGQREAAQPEFGGAVDRRTRCRHLSVQRADEDQVPLALLDEIRDQRSGHQDRRLEIDAEGPRDLLDLHLLDSADT